jgi:hypothetical protein
MRRTGQSSGWRLVAVLLLAGACGDDGVAVTEGGSGTGTSTGTTTEDVPTTDPPTTTPTTDPTTEDVPTTTAVTVTTTTEPTTTTDGHGHDDDGDSSSTTGETTTDTTTGDTTTDTTTDTTGGSEVVGKSVSQTVNGGTVASSDNFRMVFTLGQPTANQGTYKSANFRLQGGLVGANGSPP